MSKKETAAPQAYIYIANPKPFAPDQCPSCGLKRDTIERLCKSCTDLRNNWNHTQTREGQK